MNNIADQPAVQLQYASDLHYDLPPYVTSLKQVIVPGAEIMILAGDIGRAENINHYSACIQAVCREFIHVILVPGNHEYYSKTKSAKSIHNDIVKLCDSINNLTLLDNAYLDLPGGIRIFGTTLWSSIPEENRVHKLPIVVDDDMGECNASWLNMHYYKAVYALENVIAKTKKESKQLVVVSHYPPSFDALEERYKTFQNRFFYASNLTRLLTKENISTWIYGHTHSNKDFVTPGGTRVISNQNRGHDSNYSVTKVVTINHNSVS